MNWKTMELRSIFCERRQKDENELVSRRGLSSVSRLSERDRALQTSQMSVGLDGAQRDRTETHTSILKPLYSQR
jgi:hypothetical protein